MENLRKRIHVRLVNNEKDFLKYTSTPNYVTHKLFDEDFAAIHEIKPVLMLNKPIYVGFTVLDSVTYELKSENIYEVFFKWKDLFDFSNYSKDSKFFDDTNKKVIGKMKDEYGGVIIDQFIGLKSKMYLIKKK